MNFTICYKEKKREEIEKKLEQKAEEERKEVSSQKKELFQARREKKQELKSLERKMENAMLVCTFLKTSRALNMLFIFLIFFKATMQ